jgi:hypothetical protein
MSASFSEFSVGATHARFGQIGHQYHGMNNDPKFVGPGQSTREYGESDSNDADENKFAGHEWMRIPSSGTK